MSNRTTKILLAPNGNPSNLNEEQYYLVRTPEFKAWFGDWERLALSKVKDPAMDEVTLANLSKDVSKVVDENGEPLVVYHSTDKKFTQFDYSLSYDGAIWFTENVQKLYNKEAGASASGIIYQVFLKIDKLGNWDDYEEGISFLLQENFNGAKLDDDYIVFEPNQIKLGDGSNTTFDGSNPDIRFDDGGKFEKVDLKMYDTTPEHAKEYGLECSNPLFIQNGIGEDVFKYIDEYAKENKHDLIFGHIEQKAEPSVDAIKIMLRKNGYSTIEGNNDFYKYINVNSKFDDGGEVKSKSFMKWFVEWYKPISDKVNISFSFTNHFHPFKEKNAVILDVFEKIDQTIDAKIYLQEIVKKADEYGVVIYLEPKPRYKHFQDNLEKKKKISKDYLVGYYEKFGFELTPNKLFMKREPNNPDIRFAEGGEVKDLIVLHNINEYQIKEANKLGGLVTPSIAILKAGNAFTDFGSITLIATKELIDPKNGDVKVFAGDVYSPSVPRKLWHVDKRLLDRVTTQLIKESYQYDQNVSSSKGEIPHLVRSTIGDYSDFQKDISRSSLNELIKYYEDKLKLVYIIDKGIKIKVPMREKRHFLFNNVEFTLTNEQKKRFAPILRAYTEESNEKGSGGVSKETMSNVYDLFLEVLDGVKKEMVSEKGEEIGKYLADSLTNSFENYVGTRYDWRGHSEYKLSRAVFGEQELDKEKLAQNINKVIKPINEDYKKWLSNFLSQFQGSAYFLKGNSKEPYTLDNLVDATSNKVVGQEKNMTFGVNQAKSFATKRFNSIEDIKKSSDKIITKEEMNLVDEQNKEGFFKLAEALKYDYDGWGKFDSLGKALADYFKGASVATALRKNDFQSPTPSQEYLFKEFADELKKSPVDYFEAKYQRAVSLREFKYAIVPKTTSKEVIQILNDNGLSVKKYSNDAERLDIINKISNKDKSIMFNDGGNMKKVDSGGITYGASHKEGGIPVKNASTGEMLEVEGGEGIVNKRSMASDKMVKMNGKQMTICEAVSHLNQMEGGVKFSCDDVKHKQFIEEMELGGELERGKRTEKEHIATLMDIYNRKYTPEQGAERIAKDHLAEDPNYYSKLQEMESTMVYNPSIHLSNHNKYDDEMKKRNFEREVMMARGGLTSCGCSHHKKEYELGGKTDCGCGDYVKALRKPRFDTGGLIDFSGKDLPKFGGQPKDKPKTIADLVNRKEEIEQNQPNEREQRNAERFLIVTKRAEELLNKDYLPILKDSQQTKYLSKYFEKYKSLNLYKLGWRFTINTDKESVGLCEYNKTLDKSKQKRNLYISYRFIIGDDNFINEMDSVILHEISHAIVAEIFFLNEFELDTTQIREVDLKGSVAQTNPFDLIDPQHIETKGHGVTWANVCIALTGGYICRMFYEYAIYNEQINPYMYKCIKCDTEDFGSNRNFAKVCKKCSTPVFIVKHLK